MYPLKQSTTITVPVFAHDANGDAVTGLLDAGFTKRISKNGGAFAAMTVTITEMENGWYSVPLSTSHTDTLGILSVTFTHASCKQINVQLRIHARIPDNLAYPTTSGRSIDVTTGGTVGVDWANVEGQATSVDLSNTSINLVDTASVLTGHTPQTGDGYAIVNSGTFGNAQLVRATTPANTLDVNATGQAGIDLDNTTGTLAKTTDITGFNDIAATDVVSAGAITTLSGAVVNVDTVDTCTTNTDMRGTDNALLAASAPTNFGDMSITVTTGLVDITQTAADKVWSTSTRTLTTTDGVKKNTALNNFEFLMRDSTDQTPKTGLTVTAERSIDGAAFAACANSVTEVANGIYKINLANTDLNGDVITLKFTATGAYATYITIKTNA